jgi:hypothetical protein
MLSSPPLASDQLPWLHTESLFLCTTIRYIMMDPIRQSWRFHSLLSDCFTLYALRAGRTALSQPSLCGAARVPARATQRNRRHCWQRNH